MVPRSTRSWRAAAPLGRKTLIPITRGGQREDVYWTYSYGPIDDEDAPNGIGGVLVVCTETTQQVLTAQRAGEERKRFAELLTRRRPSWSG